MSKKKTEIHYIILRENHGRDIVGVSFFAQKSDRDNAVNDFLAKPGLLVELNTIDWKYMATKADVSELLNNIFTNKILPKCQIKLNPTL